MLTPNAIHVLEQRYLRKDSTGKIIETPEQLFERVSDAICDSSEFKERIYNRLLNLDFLPNSPTLMNAGTEMSQLSACFVIPIEDNLTSIYDGVKNTALIFQTGGGVGATFGHIRPKNSPVKSTQGVASGPISFMYSYNTATETIKQGGKRRGAFMSILPVFHPDVLEFINCKDKGDTLSNMNISVSVTDAFMNAVEKNLMWDLEFKDKIYQTIPARDIFNQIVKHSWETGDPGLIFIDTINKNKPWKEKIESTNPCGEEPILPYESCNLASIKLSNFVKNKKIDKESLKQCIKDVTRFLDLVIDKNNYPIPQIDEKTKNTRKIGLGIMAWADALVLMNIPYNSDSAKSLADKIMHFIAVETLKASEELAIEKGCYPSFNEHFESDQIPLLRNAQLNALAPTGTISVIADCSSGIEPIYAVAYKRNLSSTIGKDLYEVNPLFLDIAKSRGFYSDTLVSEIIKNHGSIQSISYIPSDIKSLFLTAHDISFEDHIEIQSAFQKNIDGGCSKTINLLESATPQNIYDAYMLAWKSGCKGITIYRDNSKNLQVLTTGSITKSAPTPRLRFRDHLAVVREIHTACGVFYNTISVDEYGIFEDFQINSKKGGCDASQKALGRATSMLLRHNVPVSTIIKQYHRVDCNACIIKNTKNKSELLNGLEVSNSDLLTIISCADGVSKHLSDYHNSPDILNKMISLQNIIHAKFNTIVKTEDNLLLDSSLPVIHCSNCGSTNVSNDKCHTCIDCGDTKCL